MTRPWGQCFLKVLRAALLGHPIHAMLGVLLGCVWVDEPSHTPTDCAPCPHPQSAHRHLHLTI